MSLVRILSPAFQSYGPPYWAMHVGCALFCIHDHPGLAPSPQGLFGPSWQDWSLANFRGTAHFAAFAQMRVYIQNWGAQYLIARVLNDLTYRLREPLLQQLAEVIDDPSFSNPAYAECFVSGYDSNSGRAFLENCSARIVGDQRRRVWTSTSLVRFSDLCLLVDRPGLERVAIFGEVEGNHGHYLLQERYWHEKSTYAMFGVGIASNLGQPATINVKRFGVGPRVILLLGTDKNVIADFHHAVGILEKLMYVGPTDRWWQMLDPGLRDVIGIVVQHWNQPVTALLQFLSENLSVDESEVRTLDALNSPHVITTPKLFVAG